MSIQLPEGVSQEMVAQLVHNPGQTVSNSSAPVSIKATHSVDISTPAGKELRPQIGGHVAGAEKITVSPNLAIRLAEGAEAERQLKAALAAEEAERLAALDEMSPEKILARIGYLERTVKAQAKLLKGLQEDDSE